MFEMFLNLIFLRWLRSKRVTKRFLNNLGSEITEEFLKILLKLMSLVLYINKDYRKNIIGFNGRYLFRSKDNRITISAIFGKSKMKVYEKIISNTDITIIFKDHLVLSKFLFSPKPDILSAILNQDLTYDGNLNYLMKFAYMSKRLQLMATGKV